MQFIWQKAMEKKIFFAGGKFYFFASILFTVFDPTDASV